MNRTVFTMHRMSAVMIARFQRRSASARVATNVLMAIAAGRPAYSKISAKTRLARVMKATGRHGSRRGSSDEPMKPRSVRMVPMSPRQGARSDGKKPGPTFRKVPVESPRVFQKMKAAKAVKKIPAKKSLGRLIIIFFYGPSGAFLPLFCPVRIT